MPLARILQVADQALTRDPNWVQLAKHALRGLVPEAGHVTVEAIAIRRAFDAALAGDTPAAERFLDTAVLTASDPRTAGWLLEQQAMYIDHRNPHEAQVVLGRARALNPDVLRPLTTAPYVLLPSSDRQGQRASGVLDDAFKSSTDLVLGFESILSDLTFGDRTEAFEASFLELGLLLGLNASRPEKDLGDGPDNLWALDGSRYWVVEAKTGVTTKFIAKKDVNQLAGSINWFGNHYANGETAVPVTVHPARALGSGSSAVPGMRILTPRKLGELISNTRSFASALATDGWDSASVVASLLRAHQLSAEQLERYLVSHSAT